MKKYILFLIVFIASVGCNNPFSKSKLTWTAINVNAAVQQGDAHLISKDGKHILIDTGHINYAKSILLPYLKEQNASTLRAVLITHPHNDHYGGLKQLMEDGFSIGKIYMNMPTKKQMDAEYWGGKYSELLEILALAKQRNVEVVPIVQGDKLIFDEDAFIEVLYIYNGIHTPVGHTDLNDMSAITMLHHGNNRFLFSGDLNKKLGRYLAKNADNLKADILKAPHHGAEGFAPNSFFEKVNPKAIIVPAPKHLWFGKRALRLRELARQNHYETYVNGYHGHITITSDGDSYSIKSQREAKDILYK